MSRTFNLKNILYKKFKFMQMSFIYRYCYIFFPASLVLFEFSVYIANDMIQPIMLKVVEHFNVGIEWVPTSLTTYLAGGVFLQWLFGPLSDKLGRRPVMFFGVIFFIISCFIIIFTSNIKQFMIIRFFQGTGLCFIGAVGYATIQEYFNEIMCIKIVALMTNVALIAPLLGPLTGALFIDILSWQQMFIIFTILALLSLIGLFFFMPETIIKKKEKLSLSFLWNDYKQILKNINFICGALAIGFANVPLLIWISLSPVIIMITEKFSMLYYALLQLPIFGGLIFGNITLSYLINKINLIKIIKFGINPMIMGLIVFASSLFYPLNSYYFIIIGLSLYSFGLGITNTCLTRLTLYSSNIKKGTVSASMNIISMIIFIIGIESSKIVYLWGLEDAFNLLNLFNGLCWLILIIVFIYRLKIEKNNAH